MGEDGSTGVRKFVEPPSTWDAWAVRVLTIAVVVMLAASVVLLNVAIGIQASADRGRSERQAYQVENTARQCAILTEAGDLAPAVMKQLGC